MSEASLFIEGEREMNTVIVDTDELVVLGIEHEKMRSICLFIFFFFFGDAEHEHPRFQHI